MSCCGRRRVTNTKLSNKSVSPLRTSNTRSLVTTDLKLRPEALDAPDESGVSKRYRVVGPNNKGIGEINYCSIVFNDPSSAQLTGITDEALLLILIDRLEGLQKTGKITSDQQVALELLQASLSALLNKKGISI